MGLQVHNHDRHVVSPNSLCSAGILANDLIEHLGSDLSWWYIVYSITYILHSFVIGETIPNSITTKNEELVSRVKRYSGTAKKNKCVSAKTTIAIDALLGFLTVECRVRP